MPTMPWQNCLIIFGYARYHWGCYVLWGRYIALGMLRTLGTLDTLGMTNTCCTPQLQLPTIHSFMERDVPAQRKATFQRLSLTAWLSVRQAHVCKCVCDCLLKTCACLTNMSAQLQVALIQRVHLIQRLFKRLVINHLILPRPRMTLGQLLTAHSWHTKEKSSSGTGLWSTQMWLDTSQGCVVALTTWPRSIEMKQMTASVSSLSALLAVSSHTREHVTGSRSCA